MKLKLEHLKLEERYVIGVSGGPDSMALLDILHLKGYQLIVCLVNYHIRQDSDHDYEIVRKYCEQKHIELAYKECFQYEPGNFEAQARKIRYDFFVETARKFQCSAVILAHHRDDFLETVLMVKERKMGDVYYGIREISCYQNLKVIRPAMDCCKQELLDYCKAHHIDYCLDSTNQNEEYTRNYFRHQVLANYSPAMKEALYQEAVIHNQRIEEQRLYGEAWLQAHCHQGVVSVCELLRDSQVSLLLRMYLNQVNGLDPSKISDALIQSCLKALGGTQPNLKINLPVNFLLIKEYDNMYVTKIEKETPYQFIITEGLFGDFGFFKISDYGDDREGVALSSDDFPLTIRTRKSGDYMELSYGKKKLSRLFIDAKIPSAARNRWPVVLNSRQEIILVPKIAKNKHYLLAKPTWFVLQ